MAFTPISSLSQVDQKWLNYAVSRTGVAMPNCFTYSTARISQIVGYNQSLDGNTRVAGAGQLWETHDSAFSQSSTAQVGALAIYKGTGAYHYGHVANVEVVGTNMRLSQSNYGGAMYENVEVSKQVGSYYPNTNLRLVGFLVHKDLKKATSSYTKVAETGKVKILVDKLNCRANNPFNGTVCRQYNSGDTFSYEFKTVGNGHRYVGHKEGTNEVWIAISNSETQGKDLWVEFVTEIKLTEEVGVATLTVDGIQARLNSPTGSVVRSYKAGNKITYSHKYVGNGHRYIVWKEGSNNIFLAVSGTEKQGEQPWATFTTVEQDKKNSETKTEEKTEDKKEEVVDLTKNVKKYGIDISEHNGDIDLTPYKDQFVIIRSSYGEYEDKYFKKNVDKCEKLGIPYGVYHYSYAITVEQAHAETDFFLKTIQYAKNIQYGCWWDMEDADSYKQKNNAMGKEFLTEITKIFCDKVKSKGYYVGVYSTPNWFKNVFFTDYPKWYAHWGTNDGKVQQDYSGEAVLHQYSAVDIDRNVAFYDDDFYKSNPIIEEETPQNDKKDDVVEPKDESKEESTKPIEEDKTKTIAELIVELVKKLIELFKKK